jgi:hypothetical protein
MSDDEFFIGYGDTPSADRRFMLGLGVALTAGAGAAAFGLGTLQRGPGNGSWDLEERDWQGTLFTEPFPVLRTVDVDGSPRSLWLVCSGKCGVAARLAGLRGKAVTVRGSLLARDGFHMLSVSDGPDWVREVTATASGANTPWPEYEDHGKLRVSGEILDIKCFTGAMSPASGKPHKACASLCIRGGIPPGVFVRDRQGHPRMLLLIDADQRPHGHGLLPFVADPVDVAGRLLRRGGNLFLAAPLAGIVRR